MCLPPREPAMKNHDKEDAASWLDRRMASGRGGKSINIRTAAGWGETKARRSVVEREGSIAESRIGGRGFY